MQNHYFVAPLVGAWIEILMPDVNTEGYAVAPLVGAWIEILSDALFCQIQQSLLSWERGLKCTTGATGINIYCRSSRGSVD